MLSTVTFITTLQHPDPKSLLEDEPEEYQAQLTVVLSPPDRSVGINEHQVDDITEAWFENGDNVPQDWLKFNHERIWEKALDELEGLKEERILRGN